VVYPMRQWHVRKRKGHLKSCAREFDGRNSSIEAILSSPRLSEHCQVLSDSLYSTVHAPCDRDYRYLERELRRKPMADNMSARVGGNVQR
jgi:hypothetical protein